VIAAGSVINGVLRIIVIGGTPAKILKKTVK
jgi:hypothetical protein